MTDYMTFRPAVASRATPDTTSYPTVYSQGNSTTTNPQLGGTLSAYNPTDPIKRSITRNSHYSYATTPSNSTRSWVQHTQLNPPPPPPDEASNPPTPPPRMSRPLPQPQTRGGTPLRVTNTAGSPSRPPWGPDDRYEEEYVDVALDVSGDQYGWPTTRDGSFMPRRMQTHTPISQQPLDNPYSTDDGKSSHGFVGGFVRGLKRLPQKIAGYGATGEKRRLFRGATRRGTLGTEKSAATTATLPRYQSNPPTPTVTAAPAAVHPGMAPSESYAGYEQRRGARAQQYYQQPPAPSALPPVQEVPASLLSGAAFRRGTPSFRVTPPSIAGSSSTITHETVIAPHHSHGQIYQSVAPQYAQVVHQDPMDVSAAERTTVMVYTESTAAHGADAASAVDVAMPVPQVSRVPSRMGERFSRVSSARVSTRTRTPSLTIVSPPPPPLPAARTANRHRQSPSPGPETNMAAAQPLPPRAQASSFHSGPSPNASPNAIAQTQTFEADEPLQPVTEQPLQTTPDYRKMGRNGSPLSPQAPSVFTIFSRTTETTATTTTSRTDSPASHHHHHHRRGKWATAYTARTTNTDPSFYDPSFVHDINPVARFFKTLYHLPWIARGRLTVDYRPPRDGVELAYGRVASAGRTRREVRAGRRPVSRYRKSLAGGAWYRRMSRARVGREVVDLTAGETTGLVEGDLLGNPLKGDGAADLRGRRSDVEGNSRRRSRAYTIPVGGASRRTSRLSWDIQQEYSHRQTSGQRSSHRQHSHRHQHSHRRRKEKRRRHRSAMSGVDEEDDVVAGGQRSTSPIIPLAYPYAYPAYPLTYPGYAAVPPVLPASALAPQPNTGDSGNITNASTNINATGTPPGHGTVLQTIPGSPNTMVGYSPPIGLQQSFQIPQQPAYQWQQYPHHIAQYGGGGYEEAKQGPPRGPRGHRDPSAPSSSKKKTSGKRSRDREGKRSGDPNGRPYHSSAYPPYASMPGYPHPAPAVPQIFVVHGSPVSSAGSGTVNHAAAASVPMTGMFVVNEAANGSNATAGNGVAGGPAAEQKSGSPQLQHLQRRAGPQQVWMPVQVIPGGFHVDEGIGASPPGSPTPAPLKAAV